MITFLYFSFILVSIYFHNLRLDVALDIETAITKKFSGSYFYEEMKGMAAATGLDEKVW